MGIAREYKCESCGFHLEENNNEVREECPRCKSRNFHQKLSKSNVVFTKSFRMNR